MAKRQNILAFYSRKDKIIKNTFETLETDYQAVLKIMQTQLELSHYYLQNLLKIVIDWTNSIGSLLIQHINYKETDMVKFRKNEWLWSDNVVKKQVWTMYTLYAYIVYNISYYIFFTMGHTMNYRAVNV